MVCAILLGAVTASGRLDHRIAGPLIVAAGCLAAIDSSAAFRAWPGDGGMDEIAAQLLADCPPPFFLEGEKENRSCEA
jgi:hypothetical protein